MRHFHSSDSMVWPWTRPGLPAPLPLLTRGMSARRISISTQAAPASSAVAALSMAEAPAPTTPTRLPRSVA
jgi:hypothetical protein